MTMIGFLSLSFSLSLSLSTFLRLTLFFPLDLPLPLCFLVDVQVFDFFVVSDCFVSASSSRVAKVGLPSYSSKLVGVVTDDVGVKLS